MAKIIDWDDRIGRHLKLRDLRAVFALVECGSMAKAAALSAERSHLDERTDDLLMGLWVAPRTLAGRGIETYIEILFEDHLVVAAGVSSRWARRRAIDLAELIDDPWALPPPGAWTR